MKENKMIIWQNIDINIDDWREYYQECCDLLDNEMTGCETDDQLYEWIDEQNAISLDDERYNLNVNVGDEIIVIGDLGLWNGRRNGYKIIKSGNIKDCLYNDCDYCEWYCDDKDMRFTGIHHDGTNYYRYRTWRKGISERQKDTFLNELVYGEVSEDDIKKYTKSIRPFIARVYGWPGRKKI